MPTDAPPPEPRSLPRPTLQGEPASRPRRAFVVSLAGWGGLGSGLALGGCGGAAGDQASLRFVNGTTDYATADFWIGDSLVYSGLGYGGAATGYGSEDSGSLQVSMHAAGSSTAKIAATYTFASDSYTTVVAYGSLAAGMAFRFIDEADSAAASGTFKVRALHGMPALGALDLYITNNSSLSGITPTLSVSAAGELSGFVSIGSGTYRVRVTRSGDQSAVLFDYTAGLAVGGTTVLTLAIVPRSGGSLPNLAALPEATTPAILVNELS